MDIVVGIGEFAISNNENDVIMTFALGSCIAFTAYSPTNKVLGMVHIALPDSSINPSDKKLRPGYFVDTAVPMLIDKMNYIYGSNKKDLIYKLYGGAYSMNDKGVFNIGRKNIEAIKKMFSLYEIGCSELNIGGSYSRTIKAEVATGNIKLLQYPMKL